MENVPTIISVFALIASAASCFVAYWSFRHSKRTSQRTEALQSREAKADLLGLLSDARIILERSYTQIGALLADYDGETQPVKDIVRQKIDPLRKHIESVALARDSIEEEWIKFHTSDHDIGYEDLLRVLAEVQDKVNDYKHHHDIFANLVDSCRQDLERARRYTLGATRD